MWIYPLAPVWQLVNTVYDHITSGNHKLRCLPKTEIGVLKAEDVFWFGVMHQEQALH